MKRTKVAHIITGLGTGGSEIMLGKLLAHLDPTRVESMVISLLSCDGLQIPRNIRELGINVRSLELNARRPNPLAIIPMIRRLRAFQPDVISSGQVHGNFAATCAGFFLPRVPLVWTVLGSLDDDTTVKRPTRALIRVLARASHRPRRIIYDSRSSARQHEAAGYDSRRTIVIPGGFDCEQFRPDPEARLSVRRELGLAPETPLVGILARFHPVKDHATFLRAAARIARSDPRVRFLMAGADIVAASTALYSFLVELGLKDRVSLLGERRDVARLSASLDIACLSSKAEGFPNAIGEAMASGVPCVTTNVGDLAWMIGATGRVVPSRDWEAFAAAVVELLEMAPGRRCEMGAKARQRIVEEFAIQKISRAYEDLYVSVTRRRNPTGSAQRQAAGGSSFA